MAPSLRDLMSLIIEFIQGLTDECMIIELSQASSCSPRVGLSIGVHPGPQGVTILFLAGFAGPQGGWGGVPGPLPPPLVGEPPVPVPPPLPLPGIST